MMLAGGALGGQALGSIMPGAPVGDAWPGMPIDVIINDVSYRSYSLADSLRITDTLGQQVTARLTLVNPPAAPVVGDQIRIVWYSLTIFAGSILRINRTSNNTATAKYYQCDCVDYTQILIRRKVNRNFTNNGMIGIVDSLIDNELAGEGLSIGTVDRGTELPLVDADGARALDTLREAAASTGQAMYVGFDKTINFVSTSNPSMPVSISESNVERAEVVEDLESYRNKQYVIVKGTPASESTTDALEIQKSDTNDDQIDARALIEGGSGLYEEYEKITHPTSNAQADLELLALAYARLRLSTNGTPRSTLKARIRQYGFRAGQVGDVTVGKLDVSGEWLIQRVLITEQSGRKLVHDLELVQSSLQWRGYLAWLNIVKTGKVTVLPPTAITSNSQTFTTSSTWTVPVGVTQATFTCRGASGASGGRWVYSTTFPAMNCSGIAYGGAGGSGGLGVVTITVVAGQIYTITVGAAGLLGINGQHGGAAGCTPLTSATAGTAGSASSVSLSGTVYCQGDGGGGGGAASGNSFSGSAGSAGSDGSGIGDAVTVGGGVAGAAATPGTTSGGDGSVEVNW